MRSPDEDRTVKIVVYPHDLHIGGSQINAIEIASRIARGGNECIVFGRPGPLVDRVHELGLEFVPSPDPGRRPSGPAMATLAELVGGREIDVIHGYEWPPSLEAWLVSLRSPRPVAAVSTVMSMAIAPFLPRTLPLVVGTAQIEAAERQSGRRLTTLIEPPVDLVENAPSPEGCRLRSRWGISDDETCIVTVTRLAHELKLEGILSAIDAMPVLNTGRIVRLLIVGDGPARAEVQDHASRVNGGLGFESVVLAGSMEDPRDAYDAADVVLGMGGSALRALAFGKPLIVQGERGFWRLLTPDTVEQFLWTGWYGIGDSVDAGAELFVTEIGPILDDSDRRETLGRFGRHLVEQRFGLDDAAERQLVIYKAALALRAGRTGVLTDLVRSGMGYSKYVGARKGAKFLGRITRDDFNSRPVVMTGPPVPGRST